MSFNENHIIDQSNYEEWFVLYMDNELSASQKEMVDQFLLLHPHLQEELDLLLSTKLPAEDVVFFDKSSLQAGAMKLNIVDESLLLYIDNELSATEQKRIEEKIAVNTDLRLQHQLLQKTKLDASEVIPYPDKKELYRHTEKVVWLFPVWMRVAVAVIILLFASLFFLVGDSDKIASPDAGLAQKVEPVNPATEKAKQPVNNIQDAVQPEGQPVIAQTNPERQPASKSTPAVQLVTPQKTPQPLLLPAEEEGIETEALAKVESVKTNTTLLTEKQAVALNKIVANPSVTSANLASYNPIETPEEPAVTEGDFEPKKSSAKGFLRKVTRFLERRTGLGTANADNEILVGAVALKLN
ncbi:cell envelope integrity protein TolA [Flavisolibacter sp. BT320]|nr:cell envelope integrity protein TolA [Flavisolibacter longurius]